MAKESEETKVGDKAKEPTPPLETKVPEEPKVPEVPKTPEENPEEVRAKSEHLANVNKAIEEANEELRKKRKLLKDLGPEEDEELPRIDLNDPSSKAWNKRIIDAAAPAQKELEKAKDERRSYTLRKFLSDKPELAKDPTKVKAMMETYDKLKTSTELTSEGIEMDLERAYAAENREEVINLARQARVDRARNDAILADPAVTKESTAYSKEQPKIRVYSDEEKAILMKWNITPEQHAKEEEEMKKKA